MSRSTHLRPVIFTGRKRKGCRYNQDPDVTAQVITKLGLGERVCYVGENEQFAIVDWSLQHELNEARDQVASEEKVAYIRLVDLWTPSKGPGSAQKGGTKGFVSWVKQYYHYVRSGGVPEDGLIPYRPVLDLFGVSPKCQKGQLGCEDKKK